MSLVRYRWPSVAIAVLFVTAIAAACGNDDDIPAPTPTPAHEEEHEDALQDDDPGIVHVHGLGINPADDALYIATHYGLFRLEDGAEPHRVGDRLHDFMGFTVIGADHFLSSGHPDIRDYRDGRLPPVLGLLESTDGGESWESGDLLGEVDFHALRFAHGRVYGFDSTSATFMVFADETGWERRASFGLFDFVVRLDDPDSIVASTPQGLVMSDDGGLNWTGIPAAPVLLWLDQSPGGELWGIDLDGRVFRESDDSQWSPTGAAPGRPEALLATDEGIYVAVQGSAIVRSADGGETWTTLYQP